MGEGDRTAKVLILSPHAMTAALVGWYVELSNLVPAFAGQGETPDAALSRVRPLLVLLIDAELAGAPSDVLVARATRRGVGVAVFSGRPPADEVAHWAARSDVVYFKLPSDIAAFGRALDRAARGPAERRRGDRRRPGSTHRAVDGTLVFSDRGGQAWYVYDRRVADQRGGGAVRVFVGADGAQREVSLDSAGVADRSVIGLEGQLTQAVAAPT